MGRSREEYNEYMRVYMTKRYHARRARAIEYLGGKCIDCGTSDSLEFDHKDPSQKTIDISGQSYSEERFMAELLKCELRCKPCHHRKTMTQRSFRAGGCGERGLWRCPCVKCKNARRIYAREYATRKATCA